MVGVVPAFVAALGFAAFQTINRRALSGVDVYRGTASVLGIGTVLLVGVSLLLHGIAGFVDATPAAYGYFVAAGLVHFFCGWTLLGMSQLRLGAARAGIVVGTLPLFGALVAAALLDEPLSAIDLVGLVLVVGGVALVIPARSSPPAPTPVLPSGDPAEPRGTPTPSGPTPTARRTVVTGIAAGLATALLWSVSPVLIRGGLAHGAEPITGAAIGQAAAAVTYALVIAVTARRRRPRAPITRATRRLIAGAGAAVALAIWMQWTAYDLAPIAVVLSVLQFTPPLVVVLATLVSREQLGERAWRVWAGSLVTLAGALLLIAL
jgi:drug/metabolite transporter (DMT)-like permease